MNDRFADDKELINEYSISGNKNASATNYIENEIFIAHVSVLEKTPVDQNSNESKREVTNDENEAISIAKVYNFNFKIMAIPVL